MSDAAYATNASESASWDKLLVTEQSKQDNQIPSKQGEGSALVHHARGKNGILLIPKAEGVLLEQKAGKVSRNPTLSSKRPRTTQLQDPTSLVGVDGIKDMSHKLGSCPPKISSSGFYCNNLLSFNCFMYICAHQLHLSRFRKVVKQVNSLEVSDVISGLVIVKLIQTPYACIY